MTSESLWHQHAALFRRLYIDENKTLKEVKLEVEGAYGFPSNSLSTYETKLREVLALRKNLSPEGWLAIGQRIRNKGDRKWEVYVHGRRVPTGKVMKEIGRYARHESSSRDLPMPREARIKWTGRSSSRSADRSIEGRQPQQMVLPTLSDSVMVRSRNEEIEMADYYSSLSVRSPSDVLDDAKFLSYNRPEIINQTIDIARAARKYISTSFCAAVLDPRLRELWEPRLNCLPFFSVTHTLDRMRAHDIFASHVGTGSSQIGLSTNGTVSTQFDLWRILGLLTYYLSNQFDDFDQVEAMMIFFTEKVPLTFVGKFLRTGSPAIEESWMRFAEWSFELGKKKFFEKVMQVSLSCPAWVQLHGARCLVFAANLGCTKVVRTIIQHGVSPDERSNFFTEESCTGSTPGFYRLVATELKRARYRRKAHPFRVVTTYPLLEAAVKGRIEILKILKAARTARADCQDRVDGLTTTGFLISAHEYGLIDKDDLLLVLPLLDSTEEDVDAPICERVPLSMLTSRSPSQTDDHEREVFEVSWSNETLLDALFVTLGGSSLFGDFQRQSQIPHGVLTVSGILQSAEGGQDMLHQYMTTIRYPRGIQRKQIEEIALLRSLQRPKAFKSMMEFGFQLEIKTLDSQCNYGEDWTPKSPRSMTGSYQSTVDGLEYFVCGSGRFPAPVSKLISELLSVERLLSNIKLLDCSDIESLIPKLNQSQIQEAGVQLLERSVSSCEPTAVEACLKAGVSPQEIDILGLLRSTPSYLDILGPWTTRHRMSILILLHDYGARLNLSPNGANGRDLDEMNTKMLRWLMSNLPYIDGRASCDIVTQFLIAEVDWSDSAALERWIADFDHDELFGARCQHNFDSTAAEAYRYSTSTSLALYICLGSSIQLIPKLLEQSICMNSRQVLPPKRRYSMDTGSDTSIYEPTSTLVDAVRTCDIRKVQTLLDQGDDINKFDNKGQTALEIAVKVYVKEYESNCDSEKATASKQLINTLLENGADPNFAYHKAFCTTASPSLVCTVKSWKPDLQLIQLLLEEGASAHTQHEHDGSSLVQYVLDKKQIDFQVKKDILALLLAHGASYSKSHGILSAGRSGDIELVRFHLENGADPNGQRPVCYSQPSDLFSEPYTWSSDFDSWCFEFEPSSLLDSDPFEPKKRVSSPLEESAKLGNVAIALVLLAAGASMSDDDCSLVNAAKNGRLDMVALLLPLEKRNKAVEEALKCALEGRYYSIIRLLREHLATANRLE